MPWAMSPDFSYISTFFYFSIYVNIEMIAYVWPATTFNMPLSYSVNTYILTFSCLLYTSDAADE